MSIINIENLKVNSKGTNKEITANILSDLEMMCACFDEAEKYWLYDKKIAGHDLSLQIVIPKDLDMDKLWIYVLDESFCQPYDYEYYIINAEKNGKTPNETALYIFEYVENQMQLLSDIGIIKGWKPGMYV